MKKLLILAIITLPLTSFARKPAVEPVTGISIDEYKEVPPSEAQGYNWNKSKAQVLKSKENLVPEVKGDVTKLPEREISSTTSGADLTPAIVLFFMLILPFGIWYFLLGSLEEPETEIGFQEDEDNTLAFPQKNKKDDKDGDDDDFNIPKAS